jgi:CBS domain containing-hemolysin-like protein
VQKARLAGTRQGRRVLDLLARPDRLLSSILLGNTLVNVAASSVAAVLLADLMPGGWGLGLSVVGMTFVLLVFGEISPKVLSAEHAQFISVRVAPFVGILVSLTSPISSLLSRISGLAVRVSGASHEQKPLSEAEMVSLLELGHREGVLGSEALVTVALLTLGDRQCREAMVPRSGVTAVRTGWTRERTLGLISATRFTRYPLLDGPSDRVTGFVDSRDALTSPAEADLPVYWMASFPENATLESVLAELRSGCAPIGAVFDEYGDWAGIVTVEDILDYAVFHSMGSGKELPDGVHRSGGGFLVPGDLRLDALSRLLDVVLDAEFAETCAGLLEESTGRIPEQGEVITGSGLVMTVISRNGPRIESVLVRRAPGAADGI